MVVWTPVKSNVENLYRIFHIYSFLHVIVFLHGKRVLNNTCTFLREFMPMTKAHLCGETEKKLSVVFFFPVMLGKESKVVRQFIRRRSV